MKIDPAREIALKILYEVNEKGAYTNISLNKYLESQKLNNVDRAFINELVYGAIKWQLKLDWIIRQFSKVRTDKISHYILNILRLGVYQLLYTDRIPQSAACNESVNLARKYGHSASSGFVNALLRNVAANRNNIKLPDRETEYEQYLSVEYSHPLWLVKEWLACFGNDFTESLMSANNARPDFTVRVNTMKLSRESLIELLNEKGFSASRGRYADEAVIIENPASILKSALYSSGFFQVQDEASMLAGRILDPRPGETVIDLCAAPGGKTAHIAQLMENKGIIIARDIHEHKIKLINDSSERMGFNIIRTGLHDASVVDRDLAGKADRVLADLPCTGLGIIRRKPDIKWVRKPDDRNEIAGLQKKILKAASEYVKPGGTLVYSTCTIGRSENEDIVEEFLNSNNSFYPENFGGMLPPGLKHSKGSGFFVQFYPNVDEIDGFFIAKMRRKG